MQFLRSVVVTKQKHLLGYNHANWSEQNHS